MSELIWSPVLGYAFYVIPNGKRVVVELLNTTKLIISIEKKKKNVEF